MVFHKGRAKTGGRKKATRNRATDLKHQLKAEAEARRVKAELASREEIEFAVGRMSTMSPLEVMLMGMHLKLNCGELEGAVEIAAAAAPYTSPRLNASDVRVQHTLTNKSDAEVAAEIESLREKIDKARLQVANTIPPMIEATVDGDAEVPATLAEPVI